jgi:hypothetical protein
LPSCRETIYLLWILGIAIRKFTGGAQPAYTCGVQAKFAFIASSASKWVPCWTTTDINPSRPKHG